MATRFGNVWMAESAYDHSLITVLAGDVGVTAWRKDDATEWRAVTPGTGMSNWIQIAPGNTFDQGGGLVNVCGLPNIAAAAMTSGTAYAVYMGRSTRNIIANFVEFHVTTGGTGAQTAEAGIFSSPLPPSKAGQTLTKIVATGTVDALTGTGVMRNTADFATFIAAGTHVWCVLRVAMATTQPQPYGLTADMAQGKALALAGASALTGVTTIAGAIIAASVAWQAPDLRLVCT